jgi:hypothetical protein
MSNMRHTYTNTIVKFVSITFVILSHHAACKRNFAHALRVCINFPENYLYRHVSSSLHQAQQTVRNAARQQLVLRLRIALGQRVERLDGTEYERLDQDGGQRRDVARDASRHESLLVLVVAADGARDAVGQRLQQTTTGAVLVQSDHRLDRPLGVAEDVLKFRPLVDQDICTIETSRDRRRARQRVSADWYAVLNGHSLTSQLEVFRRAMTHIQAVVLEGGRSPP